MSIYRYLSMYSRARRFLPKPGSIPATAIRWTCEILVVVLIVVVFTFALPPIGGEINQGEVFRGSYNALVGLLFYVGIRLLLYVAGLVLGASRGQRHPEVDAALDQLEATLRQQGWTLGGVPLFLVFGADRTWEANLPANAGGPVRIDDPSLPVHFYGNPETGIYMTMPGASATTVATASVAGDAAAAAPAAMAAPSATLGGAAPLPQAVATPQAARRGPAGVAVGQDVLSRLDHLLGELRSRRGAVVPANGMVLRLPADWLVRDVSGAGAAMAADLAAVRRELRFRMACWVVVGPLNDFDGGGEFVVRHAAQVDRIRLGVKLPPRSRPSDGDFARLHGQIVAAFTRICQGDMSASLDSPRNDRLVSFLHELDRSRGRFVALMRDAFAEDPGDPDPEPAVYLGAVYFDGAADGRPLGFLPAVLQAVGGRFADSLGWGELTRRSNYLAKPTTYLMMLLTALLAGLDLALVFLLVVHLTGSGATG